MTDNIGEQMTDEELHAAQPAKDFKFNMYDENTTTEYRDVVVPNWIARDGRWAEVYNALSAAGNRRFAKATEQIVAVLERARQYGREEAEQEYQKRFRREREGNFVPQRSESEKRFDEAVAESAKDGRRRPNYNLPAMPRQIRKQLSVQPEMPSGGIPQGIGCWPPIDGPDQPEMPEIPKMREFPNKGEQG